MADVTKPVRRGRNRTKQEVEERAPDLDAEETSGESQDEQGGGGDDQRSTVTSEIKDTIRDAAIEVLRPVAKKATTSAAKYAVTRGPDLVKDKVLPMVEDAGGAGALAKGALSKGGGSLGGLGSLAGGVVGKVAGGGGGGGKKPTGHGRGRRLPVQEFVDVAVDIETAYDQFTQFEDFPQFMHRVEKIEQRDDTTLMWHENIWGVRRSWEAEIVEQKPCERIVWRSKGQTQTVGVVTFHRLSDKLTRIYVNLDFQPKGLFEKTASGMRLSRRALRSDLMRFKAWAEMRDESTGAWRGVIEDGEVTEPDDSGDEGTEDTEARGDEDEEEFEDEPVEDESEDEEPRAEEDEEYEDEEPEEDEEEPRGRGRFARDEDEEEEPEEEEEEEVEEKPKRAPRRSRSSSSSSTRKPRTRARRG